MTLQQSTQSIFQFLVVFIAQLTALATANGGKPPTTLEEVWLPFLVAIGGAFGIWSGSKVSLADDKGPQPIINIQPAVKDVVVSNVTPLPGGDVKVTQQDIKPPSVPPAA